MGCTASTESKASEQQITEMLDLDLTGEAKLAAMPRERLLKMVERVSEEGLDGCDAFTKFMFMGAKRAHKEWTLPSFEQQPAFRGPEKLERLDLNVGIKVPMEDEDWPGMSFLETWTRRLSTNFPFSDEKPQMMVNDEEGAVLNQLLFAKFLPPTTQAWPEFTSDRAQSLIAFGGLGMLYLQAVSANAPGKPKDAVFMVDFDFLKDAEVRPGFIAYGSTAYFAADHRILGIHVAATGRLEKPGDGAVWEHAKFNWRTCMFSLCTVREHFMHCHLIISNGMVTGSRECLGAKHPLKRFLRPFTFRTAAINFKSSSSLVNEDGLLHRTTALTHKGLMKVYELVAQQFKYESYPDFLKSKKLPEKELLSLPCYEDGVPYWKAVAKFTRGYVDIHWADDAAISADAELQAFWKLVENIKAEPGYGLPAKVTKQALADYLTHSVFAVTAMHEWVGNITEYALLPRGFGGRLRQGQAIQDKQGFVQLLIVASLTGMRQPPLYSDWKVFFDDAETKEKVHAAVEAFLAECRGLDAEVERRNERREVKFAAFMPKNMECSVSI